MVIPSTMLWKFRLIDPECFLFSYSILDIPYDQLANCDCTKNNLMLLFTGENGKNWLY